jgi:phospholipase C
MKNYISASSLMAQDYQLRYIFALCAAMLGVLLCPRTASASCTAGTTNPSVTICLPTQNAIVPTPTHVVASTTDSTPVTNMKVLVDNSQVYSANSGSVDTYVKLGIGKHVIVVQATDKAGQTFSSKRNVSMMPPCSLSSTIPSITICNPPGGATVSSPVHLVAGFTDPSPLSSIKVVQNGTVLYQTSTPPLNVYLTGLTSGSHTVTISAKDIAGVTFSKSLSFSVTSNAGLSNLHHIIFFVQENHTFDDYFGRLGVYRSSPPHNLPNNIDGISVNTTLFDLNGNAFHPYHFATVCTDNLGPSWNPSWIDIDGGKMDAFSTPIHPTTYDPTNKRVAGFYDNNDLPYYYELATQFATSDRFFAPIVDGTNPNRMYLFAATSFGHINPDSPPPGGWTQPTIFDHLDAAGISWRYYYQDQSKYISEWSTYQRDAAKVVPISNWYNDVKTESTLPKVIFIERAGTSGYDEHPLNNIQAGAARARQIIQALLNVPSTWRYSAFILTYDEGGGFYDHVLPFPMIPPDSIAPMLKSTDQVGDFAHTGFRVPMIVISPWVKPHFVSHVARDYTSILRLIEVRFGVPHLTARDATADDMMEFFDFSSAHWLTPPTAFSQPTTGACDFSKEIP